MDILLVHNSYQNPGGEDEVVNAERGLLAGMGHQVSLYRRNNEELRNVRILRALRVAAGVVWATDSRREISRLILDRRPNIVHFHNTFPLISPSAYSVARSRGVTVVQTLHNYRLLCCKGVLYRDGRVCEDCVGKRLGLPGILHGCYRGSRLISSVAVGAVAFHWMKHTWDQEIEVYVAPTRFAASMFAKGGFPEGKIVVKPHFVHPDPRLGHHRGGYVLFVGRLAEEKGVRTVLATWERLQSRIPLRIIGDGPLGSEVASAVRQEPDVEWLGRKKRSEVMASMRDAALIVVPSLVHETFCLVVAEGFATGTPAIVSGHGALAEIVEDGRTGLHFRPGDPDDLAAKVEWAWTHPKEMAEMGREARLEYERKYTAERNYQMLMDIYDMAISRARH